MIWDGRSSYQSTPTTLPPRAPQQAVQISRSFPPSPQLKPPRQTLPRADDLQSMCSLLEEIPPTQQLHRMRLALDMLPSPSMCTPRPLARISLQLAIHRPGASPLRGPSFFSHAAYMYSPFCDGLMLVSHVASTPCTLHPHDAHRLLDAGPQYWRRLAVHFATHELAKQGTPL